MWISGSGLMLDPGPANRAAAIAAARAELLAAGLVDWDVDEMLDGRHVRVERVWWSDTAGFAHANHAGARRVVMVLGIEQPNAEETS